MTDSPESGAPIRKTIGLTGLTSNAMALIAPGAFLWLTFFIQCAYGAPMASEGMWFGILVALLLCLATAVSYAELSKLYPGAGSSYFFAEQAFLSKREAFKWARLAKFVVGWASHLYYWVYPGLMVGTTALVSGYMLGTMFPSVFNASVPSPLFMVLFCIVFSIGVAYIAFRGVGGTTAVNAAINIIQITALIIFATMAIRYRVAHPEGSKGWALDANGTPTQMVAAADGKLTDVTVSYAAEGATKAADGSEAMQYHSSAISVISPHKFSYVIIQACVAILILVGFESVTAMGEEARNAKRDIPKAVIMSLVIQGGLCYALEYFAANYFLHNNYAASSALGSAAPVGDMMKIVGAYFFGSPSAGVIFMMVQACTVFLALIGTTLSCLSTGARVTYAMGRDDEIPTHFGMLHGGRATPHRAIWTLGIISIFIGMFSIFFNFCGPAAMSDDTIKGLNLPNNIWYSFGIFSNAFASKVPQSLLVVTLVSNFGTFMLYMMTCIVAIVAFREHKSFHGFKHVVVPVFGLVANLLCMCFFIIGPFMVPGMSKVEPFVALGVVAAWGLYGGIYFKLRSKKTGKPIILPRSMGRGATV